MNCQDAPIKQSNDLGCLALVLLSVGVLSGAMDGLLVVWILSWVIEINATAYPLGVLIGSGVGVSLAAAAMLVISRLTKTQ